MKLRDMTELAVRNLHEAILRNSLTTLGVAVGVASLVAMLSLGVGLQQLASSRLAKSGLFDSIFVTSKRIFATGRGPSATRRRTQSAAPRRSSASGNHEAAECNRGLSANPVLHGSTLRRKTVRHDGCRNARIFETERRIRRHAGSLFSSPNADEAILQIEFAKELNPQTAN
jgi:putative ABC transport system permease protein